MITIPIEFFSQGEPEAFAIARWLQQNFTYVRDVDNPITGKVPEHWPPRSLIEAELQRGRVDDDCDGCSLMAVYALADHGVKARVVICMVPAPRGTPNTFESDGEWYTSHMVAESEDGYVISVDTAGTITVRTWPELQAQGWRKTIMSGFFEFEPEPRWTEAL